MIIDNPYKQLEEEDMSHVQAFVDKNHKRFLKSIHPDRGFLQLMVTNITKAIHDDLKQLGIEHWNGDSADVAELLLRRRTVDRPNQSTLEQYVARGLDQISTRLAHSKAGQPDNESKIEQGNQRKEQEA